MMNSTNKALNDLIVQMKSSFPYIEATIIQDHEIAFDLMERDIHTALSYIKNLGWRQLSIISCVDWIAENKFQLVFNLFNWQVGVRVLIRIMIDRDNPKFNTIINIFPGAKYYETEIHEFFGIIFVGNDDALKPLFLETWDDIPPYRKDFNSRAYSDKKYVKRCYNTSFGEPGGEENARS